MSLIQPMPYVISAAPNTPAAASSIAYTIDLNTPTGILSVPNVKPHSDRPPDEIDTQPLKVGTAGWAFGVGSELQVLMHEREAYGPCPEGIAGVTDEGSRLLIIVAAMTADQRAQLRSLLNG